MNWNARKQGSAPPQRCEVWMSKTRWNLRIRKVVIPSEFESDTEWRTCSRQRRVENRLGVPRWFAARTSLQRAYVRVFRPLCSVPGVRPTRLPPCPLTNLLRQARPTFVRLIRQCYSPTWPFPPSALGAGAAPETRRNNLGRVTTTRSLVSSEFTPKNPFLSHIYSSVFCFIKLHLNKYIFNSKINQINNIILNNLIISLLLLVGTFLNNMKCWNIV